MELEANINGHNLIITVSKEDQVWLKRYKELQDNGMSTKDAWNTASKEVLDNSMGTIM